MLSLPYITQPCFLAAIRALRDSWTSPPELVTDFCYSRKWKESKMEAFQWHGYGPTPSFKTKSRSFLRVLPRICILLLNHKMICNIFHFTEILSSRNFIQKLRNITSVIKIYSISQSDISTGNIRWKVIYGQKRRYQKSFFRLKRRHIASQFSLSVNLI